MQITRHSSDPARSPRRRGGIEGEGEGEGIGVRSGGNAGAGEEQGGGSSLGMREERGGSGSWSVRSEGKEEKMGGVGETPELKENVVHEIVHPWRRKSF